MAEKSFITQELVDWVKSLTRNGLVVVDSNGRGDFSPSVRDLIGQLHESLAGTPEVKRELDSKLKAALGSFGQLIGDLPDPFMP